MLKKALSPNSTIPKKNITTKDWLHIKAINTGIICLKSGEYLIIIEVLPINFKLRSKLEKRSIILNYQEFLKACHYPIQISIQCKKSDIEPHIKKMEQHYKQEKNENVRNMAQGYINLVRSLGKKGAVSRRFFLVIPYVQPAGIKNIEFSEIDKQLSEKKAKIVDYLKQCGNAVVDAGESGDTEYTLNILYSCLNKRTSDVQRFSGKFLSLSGIMCDLKMEDGEV